MTDTSTTTSPGTAATTQLAPSVAKVLAALHRLGEATAAGTAAEAGLGYSTTTPKLRTLENQGLAEPIRTDDGRTLWRLTDDGRAYAQHEQPGDPGPSTAEPAATEASEARTSAAEDRQRDDSGHGTSERGDDAPAQAEVPGEGSAGISRPAPSDLAGVDDPQQSTADGASGGESGTAPASAAAGPAADALQTGDAAQDTGADGAQAAAPAKTPPAEPVAESAALAGLRRSSGTLRGAILDVLEANPGRLYKVSELCKLIDQANEGSGAKKASAGAVHNAATKLVEAGRAVLAVEKPVTFTLAGTDADGSPTTSS